MGTEKKENSSSTSDELLSDISQKLTDVLQFQKDSDSRLSKLEKYVFDSDESDEENYHDHRDSRRHHSNSGRNPSSDLMNNRELLQSLAQQGANRIGATVSSVPQPIPYADHYAYGSGAACMSHQRHVPFPLIQEDYESVKDSLNKVKLSGDMLLGGGSGAGISGDDRPKFQLISRISKYFETALKWTVRQGQAGQSTQGYDELNDLAVILTAGQTYLKEELAALMVNGTAKGAGKYYRMLRTNRGMIDPDDARVALEFSAAASKDSAKPKGGFKGKFKGNKPWEKQHDQPPRFRRPPGPPADQSE